MTGDLHCLSIVRAPLDIDGVALVHNTERAVLVIPKEWLSARRTDALNRMLAELDTPRG
jgi:hypothetical protein